jgi:hypothetical protein
MNGSIVGPPTGWLFGVKKEERKSACLDLLNKGLRLSRIDHVRYHFPVVLNADYPALVALIELLRITTEKNKLAIYNLPMMEIDTALLERCKAGKTQFSEPRNPFSTLVTVDELYDKTFEVALGHATKGISVEKKVPNPLKRLLTTQTVPSSDVTITFYERETSVIARQSLEYLTNITTNRTFLAAIAAGIALMQHGKKPTVVNVDPQDYFAILGLDPWASGAMTMEEFINGVKNARKNRLFDLHPDSLRRAQTSEEREHFVKIDTAGKSLQDPKREGYATWEC